MLVCTVRGDIHDIGKGILDDAAALLRVHRARPGRRRTAGRGGAPVVELAPDIVGLSGLLTPPTPACKATVDELRRARLRPGATLPIIIGGGAVDEQVREWSGADLWAADAVRGVDLIRDALAARGPNGLAGAGW